MDEMVYTMYTQWLSGSGIYLMVALVIGVSDVVNLSVHTDSASPVYGLPILNVDQMLYGNVKAMVNELIQALLIFGFINSIAGFLLSRHLASSLDGVTCNPGVLNACFPGFHFVLFRLHII